MCREACVSTWLKRSATGAFVMGLAIAIAALAVITWKPISPLCDTCVENWPKTYPDYVNGQNVTWPSQCGLEITYYNTDMKDVDATATQVVGLIQLGVMAVGFVVCILNLPPLITAWAEKNDHQCCRRCCGLISCFATLAGFACGVACVVIPIIAESSIKQICTPLQVSVQAAILFDLGDACIKQCIAVPIAFLDQFCDLPKKILVVTVIGFFVVLFTAMSFILNALGCCSCCLKKREKDQDVRIVPAEAY